MTGCQPAPVFFLDSVMQKVLELVEKTRPKEHVRAVVSLLSAALQRAGSRTVQSLLLMLLWRPRRSTDDVWPMAFVVRNCVLTKIIPKYEVSDRRVTDTLKRWLTE